MSIFDRLLRRKPKDGKWAAKKAGEQKPSSGRLTPGRPSQTQAMKYSRPWGVIQRDTPQGYKSIRTLKEIRDYNPDAAMAVWNFLRLVGKGAAVSVLNRRGKPNAPAQSRLDEFLRSQAAREYGGGLSALAGVCTLTILTQGAAAGELALSENLRDVLDWCPVDPSAITFGVDDQTGSAYPALAGIGSATRPEPLPAMQFRYVPLDPDVDDPYGRGPFWPALEVTFFQMEVLRDLKAVAHTAGYPHIEVSVVYDTIWANMPAHLKEPGKEDEARMWLDGMLDDIQTAYNDLKPDAVWVHWDLAKPGYVGPGQAGSINLDMLIQALDQQVVSALKQMPILLGRNFGSTETHANRQWEIFVGGVEALRDVVKRMVEFWGNATLRVWGVQGSVTMTFELLRTSDRMTDAQAARIELDTAIRRFLAGFTTHEQAAAELGTEDADGPVLLPELLAQGVSLNGTPQPAAAGGQGGRETPLLTAGAGEPRAAEYSWSELADVAATPKWMRDLFKGLDADLAVTMRQAVNEAAVRVGEITDEEWKAAAE